MLSELSPAGLAEFAAEHSSLLPQLYAESQAARWGVTQEEFVRAAWRSAAHRFADAHPTATAVETYLRGLHMEDLGMACALRGGHEAAWEEFVTRYRPMLYAAARAIVGQAGDARARELADSLYADLYGVARADGERRTPLLDYFHGRSKLATWLRAVLAQRHVDWLRAARRVVSIDDGQVEGSRSPAFRAAVSPTADPDRERLLPRLREAVSEALATLEPPERLLLSLYYVEELTLAQIARLRGTHEATASRQLERIRRGLRERIERSLSEGRPAENGDMVRAGLSAEEIQLCFSYGLEDWPLDLRRALSDGIGPDGGGKP